MLDTSEIFRAGTPHDAVDLVALRKREVAQQVGFGLLMLLMVYAVYNDLDRIGLFSFFR